MKRNSILLVSMVAAAMFASGAARGQVSDPFEPVNRVIFDVNDALDSAILRPVSQVYVNVVPRLVRAGVSNFFGNISDAFSAVNNALQGKREPLGNDLGRVLVNSTFGLGGLIDIASEGGIEKYNEDFGEYHPRHILITPKGDDKELGDAVALAGASKYVARVKCAMLGWVALENALKQLDA